jgi:hypothetical protein
MLKIQHKISMVLVLVIFIQASVWAGLIGNYFQSSEYGFSITGHNDWKASLSNRGHLVDFFSPQTGAVVYVLGMPRRGSYYTAKAFAKTYLDNYDGWIYTAGRNLDESELSRANAKDAFRAMYVSNKMTPEGKRKKDIVIETYYLSGTKACVVSAKTSDHTWAVDKEQILQTLDSFKFD